MNIFVLDYNPKLCAAYHCDKHCIKMIVESAQLLCSAHWVTGGEAPYKLAHKNHPCSIWVRESISNYLFLVQLGLELCKEYTSRYGKLHKSKSVIEWCGNNFPAIPNKEQTRFALAMPDEYKMDCPVQSYRNYYIGEKNKFATWRNQKPEWYNDGTNVHNCC
jgi:hypothetical protein